VQSGFSKENGLAGKSGCMPSSGETHVYQSQPMWGFLQPGLKLSLQKLINSS
jgi:hypothetical protein